MNVNIDNALYITEKIRHLTESTYLLRFSRNGMDFSPGQHLLLGLPGSGELREYSIYSGIHDDFLEVLVKEVDDGLVSRHLKTIKPGDPIEVRGPYGFFLAGAVNSAPGSLLFISSGTGIAPFHSYVKSFPDSDYLLIHGIRKIEEAYDENHYTRSRYIVCTSRDNRGDYEGRLTDYLLDLEIDPLRMVYLCGNSNMIFDAMDILRARGISQGQIFTEAYF